MNKLKNIIFILIGLIFFIFSLAYSKESSLFDPDGFIIMEDAGFKMGYIAGYVSAKSDLLSSGAIITMSLIEKLKKEKAISKSFNDSELMTMQIEIAKEHYEEHSYDNIPFVQLIAGVDNFYGNAANMKVTLPHALEIVKLTIKGEKEAYIKCMTEFYRMDTSGTGKLSEKIMGKMADCLKLRK